MLRNIIQPDRLQMAAVWHMRLSCWISKATNTLRMCNIYGFPTTTNGYSNAMQCYVMWTLPVLLLTAGTVWSCLSHFSNCSNPSPLYSLALDLLLYSRQRHNLVWDLPTHLFKIHLNIILSSLTRSSKFPLSLSGLRTETLYVFPFWSRLLHAPVLCFTWF
jgi:hypothetical protein